LLSSASPEVIGRLEDLDAELVVVLRAGRLVPDEAWSLLDGSGSE
jgi:hypothetical protein